MTRDEWLSLFRYEWSPTAACGWFHHAGLSYTVGTDGHAAIVLDGALDSVDPIITLTVLVKLKAALAVTPRASTPVGRLAAWAGSHEGPTTITCPECKGRRKRACACGRRFTTYEVYAEDFKRGESALRILATVQKELP